MITARELTKNYRNGEIEQRVLKGVSLDVLSGEFVAIMGRSGAGKSTLLYQLSLLDVPTSGTLCVDDVDVETLSDSERTTFRLERLGYVFQDYALIPELSALENVAVPLLMQGKSRVHAFRAAEKALSRVGLSERLRNLPSQLSGGEQQRVSIARAIAHEPKILFADEPTANLDIETSQQVLEIFDELHRLGQTIIMVTHEADYGSRADRVVTLSDGHIASDEKK